MQHQKNDDYEIIDRKDGHSVKYYIAFRDNPQIDREKALVVSIADMQFKFQKQLSQLLCNQVQQTHFGYPSMHPNILQCLLKWVQSRYHPSAQLQHMFIWTNTLSFFFGIIMELTQPDDLILVFTPTYYRFLYTINGMKRTPVEYRMRTKGGRFMIDFQELEEVFKRKKIKLVVWVSPANPTGRIWSREELQKLCDLVVKYQCYIFSDEIYSDTIPSIQHSNFTSLLTFPTIHPYLLYSNSFGKAFNCSGVSFCYCFILNPQLFTRLKTWKQQSAAYTSPIAYRLMQQCYENGAEWLVRTNGYLQANYVYFKEQCQVSQWLEKLRVYDLDCGYLMLLDFGAYGEGGKGSEGSEGFRGKRLKARFDRENVVPTYMDDCCVGEGDREGEEEKEGKVKQKGGQEMGMVRINLACNREVVKELLRRLERIVQKGDKEVEEDQKASD